VLVAGVVLLGCDIPARRAARVDLVRQALDAYRSGPGISLTT
jgi:hypothetical protein